MATETVELDGDRVTTLKEMIRPGLRAVFVGINPSPVSVAAGHYYQGTLGQRFWRRLQDFGITPRLPRGAEDDTAFARGLGFADLVRRPTRSATELTKAELRRGAIDVAERLAPAAGAVFVFAKARDAASSELECRGWTTTTMPGPYAPSLEATKQMAAIRARLG